MIQQNYKFGSPASCIVPLIQGCIKRKGAILHIYRSVHREAFIRYLDEINQHIVKAYVEYAAEEDAVSAEDRDALRWFYKCTLTGIILDWLDRGMAYDLLDFAERICGFFAQGGKGERTQAQRESSGPAAEIDPSPSASGH